MTILFQKSNYVFVLFCENVIPRNLKHPLPINMRCFEQEEKEGFQGVPWPFNIEIAEVLVNLRQAKITNYKCGF